LSSANTMGSNAIYKCPQQSPNGNISFLFSPAKATYTPTQSLHSQEIMYQKHK